MHQTLAQPSAARLGTPEYFVEAIRRVAREAPEEQRWSVVRIVTNPDRPLGLDFPEV